MNCHHCQKPIQEGFKFCPYCGAETSTKSFCPTCRSEVKREWKACPQCGSSLIQNTQTIHHQEPQIYPKHNYGGCHNSGYYYGSSSHKGRRHKGFLGMLFSS